MALLLVHLPLISLEKRCYLTAKLKTAKMVSVPESTIVALSAYVTKAIPKQVPLVKKIQISQEQLLQ